MTMKRAISALLTVAITSFAAQAYAESPTLSSSAMQTILTDRIDRDKANVGMSIAVIEAGKEPVFVYHGRLAVNDPAPVDEQTLFEAGSLTKLFTNLLLAQLVVEGRIDLDAPLTNYLPPGTKLPERDGKAITAFHLATHRAGFSGLPAEVLAAHENPYSGYDAAALMAWIAQYDLPRGIDKNFEYSNVGTALLAQALEHVTGKTYQELLQSQILEPLDMTNTRLATRSMAELHNFARGHDATMTPVENWDFAAFAPAGGLISTSADLAKFIAAASGVTRTSLTPAFDKMFERLVDTGSNNDRIGLGWFVSAGTADIAWHNGITAGYRSFAGFNRMTKTGVVVLSNMVTETGIEDIGLHILNPAIPLTPQAQPREAINIDAKLLPGYTGDYLLAPGAVISITQDGERLFAQLTGQPRFELFPESEMRFFYKVVDAQITFGTPEHGKSPALVLHQNSRNMSAIRLP
jgi:D-alanyl-D-alanine-carboxypeptidase/D-alanyl-D-alanine-endopeptidase